MGILDMGIRDPGSFKPVHFSGIEITQEEFVAIFQMCDAFWMHSGDPKDPHAELTSGLCSNGFIDCLRALSYTGICQGMASQLVDRLYRRYNGHIGWVVGSDHAGAAFSKDVANVLGARHDFTEKGPDKTQLWKRLVIPEGEVVLQIEELMTTSGTTMAVRNGIREGNPNPVTFAPVVAVLVHRSDVQEIEGSPVVYPFHFDIWTAKPEDCPLCAAGSKRLRPKANWAELTGRG